MRMNKSSVLFSTIMSAILLWHSRQRKLSNYMKPGSRSAECWDTQPIKLIISCHPAKWYRSITLVCCMDDRLSGSLKNPRAFCKGCTLTGISFIHEWGFWPNILTFHLESKNNIQLSRDGEVNGEWCFVNKRRHFVRVCFRTFQLTVFRGSFFLTILLQIQRENFFFYRAVNSDKPNFVSFLVFLAQLLQLPLKFHLSKLSRNEKPFESCPKTVIIIHSKYFPDSDWLKGHV